MRVLVTGAGGFVGRAVVARMVAAGHTTVALLHHMERAFPAGVEVRRADLTEQAAVDAAVRDVHAVCHLAALTRVRESFADPVRFFRVNVGGTIKIFILLLGAGGAVLGALWGMEPKVERWERIYPPTGASLLIAPTPHGGLAIGAAIPLDFGAPNRVASRE